MNVGRSSDAVRDLCRRVASIPPLDVPPGEELTDAIDMLDRDLDSTEVATTIVVLASLGGVLVLIAGLAVTQVVGAPTHLGLALAGTVACSLVLAGYSTPLFLAMRRRAIWIGALPGFVCRATVTMRATPTLEAGIRGSFVPPGPLAERVPRLHDRPPGALFERALADLGPAAQRIEGLLAAAPTASDHHALLDRAIETALDGTHEAMRSYTSSLHGPITAIYAFGVVLPLALVGILPAAPVAGITLPMSALALGLDVLLPVGLVAGTAWLVARRPLVNPPQTLPAGHQAFGSPRRVAGVGITAAVAGIAVSRMLPSWAIWFLCSAWPTGAILLARYPPALAALDAVERTNEAVPDLLAMLGDAMADGAPPEDALEQAGAVPGTVGSIATAATTTRRRLTIPVSAALIGEYGPLAVLDDHRRGTLRALVEATSDAGPPGGHALSRYAGHLDALQELERGLRADLARLTGTLRQTAGLYAPAIAGVTVALATRLQSSAGTLAAPGDGFALVVGGYVLVLAIVLPATATAITHGWCRVRIGVAVGRALLLAGGLFPITAELATTLL